jgi:hypothetical protein
MAASGVLTFGASELLAEPVGTYQVQQRADGAIAVTIVFQPDKLVRELLHGGMMPERKPQLPVRRDQAEEEERREERQIWHNMAAQRVESFTRTSAERLRVWLTTTLAWDEPVRAMDDEAFLRWLAQFPPSEIPRALGVPSVQERIAAIRQKGTPARRRRLADILAIRASGRPLSVPQDVVLYHQARSARKTLAPLRKALEQSKRPTALWPAIERQNPELAKALTRLTCATKGRKRIPLKELWLTEKCPSLNQMACQLVAAVDGLSWQTVEKAVGRIQAQRDPKREKPDPREIELAREAFLRAERTREQGAE